MRPMACLVITTGNVVQNRQPHPFTLVRVPHSGHIDIPSRFTTELAGVEKVPLAGKQGIVGNCLPAQLSS